MQNMHNIEPSRFRRGEYVGYAGGTVWRITRVGRGWCAVQRYGASSFVRRTLQEISCALAAYLLSDKL